MDNLDGIGQIAEEMMIARHMPFQTREEAFLAKEARRVRHEQLRWLWLFFVRACAFGDGPGGLKIVLLPMLFIAVTYGQWVAGLEMVGGIDGHWTSTAHWYTPFTIVPFVLGAAIPMAAGGFLIIGLLICPASYIYPIALLIQHIKHHVWSPFLFRFCFSPIRRLYWYLYGYSNIDLWSRTVGWHMFTKDGWTVEGPVVRYSYVRDFVLPGITKKRLKSAFQRIMVKLYLSKPVTPLAKEED